MDQARAVHARRAAHGEEAKRALCRATHCAGYQENARDMAFCERTTAVNDAAMLPRWLNDDGPGNRAEIWRKELRAQPPD